MNLVILKRIKIFAGAFNDIPTFLDEFESSSLSVAEHTVHGANIMTIHGSKGLEFGYVIVLDKLTRPNNDKSPLIFHFNDNLFVDKILYRTQGREHFDEDYAQIMESRKSSEVKDRKNVLYVALTRAVEGMIVIRKGKDSIFDEIGLETMHLGTLDILHRDKDWVKGVPFKAPVILQHYGVQEVLKQEEDEEKDYAAILFGTALHYALEMMGSFNKEGLDDAMISLQNRYGQSLSSDQMLQVRQRIEQLISNERFASMLKDAVISKEKPLSFNGEIKQVDLFLEHDDKCMVVDYKSSLKQKHKHHMQVLMYKKAIESITKKRTSGMIVYLLEEGIEIVDV